MIRLLLAAVLSIIAFPSSAANWYVDNAAGGTNNGTSWTNAWTAFGSINWASVNPGDTVYISGGTTSKTYNTQDLNVTDSGTSGSRITIAVGQEAGHNGTVIISGRTINLTNRDYVTVDGSVGGVSKMTVRDHNNFSDKDAGWAIYADDSNGLIIKYVTITAANNGIYATRAGNYEFANCSITVRGEAAIRGIISPGSWDANKIHHNIIDVKYNNGGPDGIQPGDGTSIYNNTFLVTTTTDPPSTQHPDGLQLAGSEIKVYNNEFINVGDSQIDYDAWSGGSLSNIYIYNNVFRMTQNIDPFPDTIRVYSTGDALNNINNLKIVNNTFSDERSTNAGNWGVIYFNWTGTGAGTGNEIRNNIFINTGDLWFDDRPVNLTMSNNIYPRSQGASDPTGVVGVPALNASFVPLASDTLARDQGTSLSGLFTTDKLGTTRPQGPAWDIGAFEYQPVVTDTTPPSVPGGLTVTPHP